MARQLRAGGDEVALLVMFDHVPGLDRIDAGSWRAPRRAWSWLQNAPHWLESFLELGTERIQLRARRKGRMMVKNAAKRIGFAQEKGVASTDVIDYADRLPAHRQRLIEAHARAIQNYVPQRYGGRIVLFKAQAQPLLHPIGSDLAWQAVGGHKTDIVVVPGSHEGMFKPPRVTLLAAALRREIEQARKGN